MHQTIGIISFADTKSEAKDEAQSYADDMLCDNQRPFDYVTAQRVVNLKKEEGTKNFIDLWHQQKKYFIESIGKVRTILSKYTDEAIFNAKIGDGNESQEEKENLTYPDWFKYWANQCGQYEGCQVLLYQVNDDSISSSNLYDYVVEQIKKQPKAWLVLCDTHY